MLRLFFVRGVFSYRGELGATEGYLDRRPVTVSVAAGRMTRQDCFPPLRNGSGGFAIFAAIHRASSWLIGLSRQLRSLGDDSWLVHTNIPSVPSQTETNDTGLAATSHNCA
jgi:hypothetical protein